MDEASSREEEYYAYVEKKGVFSIILVAVLFTVFFLILWNPIQYGGFMMEAFTAVFGFYLLFMAYIRFNRQKKYGFWFDSVKEIEATDRFFLYLSALMVIGGLIFSYIFYVTIYLPFGMSFADFLERLVMILGVVFLAGPYLYFARKKRLQWHKKEYGRNRAIYIAGKPDEVRKILEDSLISLGIKYSEEDMSSKLKGPKKFFDLREAGMKIFYMAYDLPSNMVLIANIPDDDTLEKRIEEEILRQMTASRP